MKKSQLKGPSGGSSGNAAPSPAPKLGNLVADGAAAGAAAGAASAAQGTEPMDQLWLDLVGAKQFAQLCQTPQPDKIQHCSADLDDVGFMSSCLACAIQMPAEGWQHFFDLVEFAIKPQLQFVASSEKKFWM